MNKSIAIRDRASQALTIFGRFYHTVVFPTVVIGSTLLYIAYYLGLDMTGGALARDWQKPISVVVVIHGFVLLSTMLEKKPIEMRILLLNVGWMFLSRCLIGNYSFEFNDECFWAIMFCMMFASGASLDKNRRSLLLSLITIELVGVTDVWGAIAIPTAVAHRSVPGFEEIRVIVQETLLSEYIQLYTYRTITAAYYLITAGLVVYHCYRKGSWFWRVIAAVYMPVSFVALALQDCRSVSIGYAMILGAVFVSYFVRLSRNKKVIRKMLRISAWISCTAFVYVSLALCHNTMMGKTANAANSEPAQAGAIGFEMKPHVLALATRVAYATEVLPTANVSQTDPAPISHARGNWWSIFTFSGRASIWEATIPALKNNKRTLLLGQPEKTCMETINACMVRDRYNDTVYYYHMHNIILQQLVVSGVPGMMLYIGLLILLMGKGMLVVLRDGDDLANDLRILPILLLTLILYGMMEPLLSLRIPISSLLFCVIAGVFVTDYSMVLSQGYSKQ